MVWKWSVLLLLNTIVSLARTAEVFRKHQAKISMLMFPCFLLLQCKCTLWQKNICQVLMVIGGQSFNSTTRGHDHIGQVIFNISTKTFSSKINPGGAGWSNKVLCASSSLSHSCVRPTTIRILLIVMLLKPDSWLVGARSHYHPHFDCIAC